MEPKIHSSLSAGQDSFTFFVRKDPEGRDLRLLLSYLGPGGLDTLGRLSRTITTCMLDSFYPGVNRGLDASSWELRGELNIYHHIREQHRKGLSTLSRLQIPTTSRTLSEYPGLVSTLAVAKDKLVIGSPHRIHLFNLPSMHSLRSSKSIWKPEY